MSATDATVPSTETSTWAEQFVKLPNELLSDGSLSSAAVRVFGALCTWLPFNGASWEVWPSHNSISVRCGLSRTHVQRSLEKLVARRHISIRHRTRFTPLGFRCADTNVYTVLTRPEVLDGRKFESVKPTRKKPATKAAEPKYRPTVADIVGQVPRWDEFLRSWMGGMQAVNDKEHARLVKAIHAAAKTKAQKAALTDVGIYPSKIRNQRGTALFMLSVTPAAAKTVEEILPRASKYFARGMTGEILHFYAPQVAFADASDPTASPPEFSGDKLIPD